MCPSEIIDLTLSEIIDSISSENEVLTGCSSGDGCTSHKSQIDVIDRGGFGVEIVRASQRLRCLGPLLDLR